MSNAVKRSEPQITLATFDDCLALAEKMREEDQKEVFHAAGLSPIEAVTQSFESSDYIYAGKMDDEIICIFGVGEVKPGIGCPWMLATDLLPSVKKTFLRHCYSFADAMNERYPLLHNKVWVDNVTHVRWLKWLGFVFLPSYSTTHTGAIFQDFVRIKYEY